MMSDGFIMNFLNLIGVPPARVTRYKAPSNEYHILYVIDTRGVTEHRKQLGYPTYLEDVIQLRFKNAA
jgi:hypothetical protein